MLQHLRLDLFVRKETGSLLTHNLDTSVGPGGLGDHFDVCHGRSTQLCKLCSLAALPGHSILIHLCIHGVGKFQLAELEADNVEAARLELRFQRRVDGVGNTTAVSVKQSGGEGGGNVFRCRLKCLVEKIDLL